MDRRFWSVRPWAAIWRCSPPGRSPKPARPTGSKAPHEARRAIMEEGAWRRPSAYSSEPDCFTRALIEDGRKHLLLGGMIRTGAPTAVLQGMRDEDVPLSHA